MKSFLEEDHNHRLGTKADFDEFVRWKGRRRIDEFPARQASSIYNRFVKLKQTKGPTGETEVPTLVQRAFDIERMIETRGHEVDTTWAPSERGSVFPVFFLPFSFLTV